MRTAICSALIVFAPTAFAQHQTWVVDDVLGPGVDFVQIQQAVDSASSGDVILVRSGNFKAFKAVGKGLVITADSGANPVVYPSDTLFSDVTRVQSVPAGESFVLRGLRIEAAFSPPYVFTGALSVGSNAGNVMVEGCRISSGSPTVEVLDSAAVSFVRCAIYGNDGFVHPDFPHNPVAGLRVSASNVFVHQTTILGGEGDDGAMAGSWGPLTGQQGAPGVKLENGALLYAAQSALLGGAGGDGAPIAPPACVEAQSGGAGLWLAAGSPSAQVRATSTAAGLPGQPGLGCNPITSGPDVLVDTGAVVTHSDSSPALVAASPVREGQVLAFQVSGQPGDLAFALAAPALSGQFLPPLASALLVGSSFAIVPLGALPPSGVAGLGPTLAELGPGIEGALLVLQAATCDPSSLACVLGSASAAVLLDSSF